MIRIAFVIDTIDKPTAGTEKQLLLLLQHLDRNKFEPVLCVLRHSKWLDEEFEQCPVYYIGIQSFKAPSALVAMLKFVRFLRSGDFTVVHSFFNDGATVGVVAGKLAKVRLNIAARRNQGYWMTPRDFWITKLLNYGVDVITTNSQNTKDWIVRTEGFPEKKIRVIYNGVNLKKFREVSPKVRANFREAHKIPPDAPVVGIVANFRPVKALDVFLRSAQLVVLEVPETHFVLVGDGDQQKLLEKLSRELCIESNVHFLGRRNDIPAILSAFDVGVLASSSESFSNAILEYFAAGLPVVCTSVGGAGEVVEDNVNGYFVPPGDYALMAKKISAIIQDRRATRMKENMRKKVEEFYSLDTMIKHHELLYSVS